MKSRKNTEATAGRIPGKVTLVNVLKAPFPATREDSSRLGSNESRAGFIIKYASGVPPIPVAKMIPHMPKILKGALGRWNKPINAPFTSPNCGLKRKIHPKPLVRRGIVRARSGIA